MKYELRYIAKYIFEYNAGIPKAVILVAVLCMCGIVSVLYLRRNDKTDFARNSSCLFFWVYVAIVLCYTIIFRNCKPIQILLLHPFGSYSALCYKRIAEIIFNVLMFMPIGFLYGGSKKKVRWVEVLCIGLGLSVSIEVMQLLSRRGVCSIDDVIHNTIGCLIGYGLFRLFYMMKPWLQWKLKTT